MIAKTYFGDRTDRLHRPYASMTQGRATQVVFHRRDSHSGASGRANVPERRSDDHRPLSPLPGLGPRRVISSPTVETVGYFRDVPGGTKHEGLYAR